MLYNSQIDVYFQGDVINKDNKEEKIKFLLQSLAWMTYRKFPFFLEKLRTDASKIIRLGLYYKSLLDVTIPYLV